MEINEALKLAYNKVKRDFCISLSIIRFREKYKISLLNRLGKRIDKNVESKLIKEIADVFFREEYSKFYYLQNKTQIYIYKKGGVESNPYTVNVKDFLSDDWELYPDTLDDFKRIILNNSLGIIDELFKAKMR